MSNEKCCGEPKAEPSCCGEPEPEACCAPKAAASCCGSAPAGEYHMSAVYDANIHATASHLPLGQSISLMTCGTPVADQTDLNPIDLLAMAVASCLLIVMGKAAQARDLCLVGARADVGYTTANYKIAGICVDLYLPTKLDEGMQRRLEAASKTCPVYLALNPEVDVKVNFIWPE